MALVLNIAYNIISHTFVLAKKRNVVYFIPLLAFLYDVLNIFLGESYPFVTFKITLYILIFLLVFNKEVFLSKKNSIVLLFVLYLVITLPLSSDTLISLTGIVQLFIALSMFSIGFSFIKRQCQVEKFGYIYLTILVLFIINFFISNKLSLGEDLYGLGIVNGSLHREHTYIASLCIVLTPMYVSLSNSLKYKIIYIIVAVVSSVILILLLRRGAIILYMIGLSCILVYVYRQKSRYIIYSIPIVVLILIVLINNIDHIRILYDARNVNLDDPIEQFEGEARSQEIVLVVREAIEFHNFKNSLIGHQNFYFSTTAGEYGFHRSNRQIHTTFALILHGMGIVGLIIFMSIIFRLHYKFLKYRLFKKNKNIHPIIPATLFALLVMLIFDLYTKSLFYNTYAPALLLMIGGLFGHIKNTKSAG